MSNQMIGANVDELDALGQQLDSAADDLRRIVQQLRGLPRNVWVGTDATQFFSDLDSTHIPGVGRVGDALRISGASVKRNAADQRSTSATLEGGSGTSHSGSMSPGASAPSASSGDNSGHAGDMMEGIVGYGVTAASAIDDLAGGRVLGDFGTAYGAVMDTGHLLENVSDGEWSAATLDALSLASNAGGPVVGSLSGVARDSFEMFVPVTSERQDAVVDWASNRFPDQNIAERYSSPLGALNMFYDSVSEATENPRNPLTFGIKAAGDGIADAIWTVIK